MRKNVVGTVMSVLLVLVLGACGAKQGKPAPAPAPTPETAQEPAAPAEAEAPPEPKEEPARAPLRDAAGNIVVVFEADAFASEEGMFDYRYTLSNQPDSKEYIAGFAVMCEAEPEKSGAPDGWTAEFAADKRRCVWSAGEAAGQGLAPGQSQGGFWIRCAGLPIPTVCTVQDTVKGITVGPGITPTPETPSTLDLLDMLCRHTRVCIKRGWIANEDLGERLYSTANAAKRLARQYNNVHTRQSLDMFVLFANQGAEATPPSLAKEGRALLLTNAEYLLRRLEQRPLVAPRPEGQARDE